MKIVIIDYGAGNLKSLQLALERLGYTSQVSMDEELIRSAEKVILPGVGHAKPAMAKLIDSGLDRLIPLLTQPVLGICLGMQLMCMTSEEGDLDKGLGIFPVRVMRFTNQLKVPHIGWNAVSEDEGCAYFVHSYFAPLSVYTISECQYGVRFSAGLRRDNFLAYQFHPEKSGKYGEEILKKFLES